MEQIVPACIDVCLDKSSCIAERSESVLVKSLIAASAIRNFSAHTFRTTGAPSHGHPFPPPQDAGPTFVMGGEKGYTDDAPDDGRDFFATETKEFRAFPSVSMARFAPLAGISSPLPEREIDIPGGGGAQESTSAATGMFVLVCPGEITG